MVNKLIREIMNSRRREIPNSDGEVQTSEQIVEPSSNLQLRDECEDNTSHLSNNQGSSNQSKRKFVDQDGSSDLLIAQALEVIAQSNGEKRLKLSPSQDLAEAFDISVNSSSSSNSGQMAKKTLVSKGKLNPMIFAEKFLFDRENNRKRDDLEKKVLHSEASKLTHLLDEDAILSSAELISPNTSVHEIYLIVSTLIVKINRLTETVKKLESNLKGGKNGEMHLMYNPHLVLNIKSNFELPDQKTYSFGDYTDISIVEKTAGKSLNLLVPDIVRYVFGKIYNECQTLPAMTTVTQNSEKTVWVPISDHVIENITELIFVGCGFKDKSSEEEFSHFVMIRKKVRTTLYNFLDEKRKAIRKEPDGATKLDALRFELLQLADLRGQVKNEVLE